MSSWMTMTLVHSISWAYIARIVKKGWRKLHTTFGGFGFRNLATEQLIERLNLLLQHYNTRSPISDKLIASLR